jgi:hypothetical protein
MNVVAVGLFVEEAGIATSHPSTSRWTVPLRAWFCQPGRMMKTMITTTSTRLSTTWATMAGSTLRVRSVM